MLVASHMGKEFVTMSGKRFYPFPPWHPERGKYCHRSGLRRVKDVWLRFLYLPGHSLEDVLSFVSTVLDEGCK